MKNLFIVSALMFGFIQAIVAAPSKAEAEVAIAFEKYFDARANQKWDTVASLESASGSMGDNVTNALTQDSKELEQKALLSGSALSSIWGMDCTNLSRPRKL